MSNRQPFACPHHGFVIEADNDDGCPECIEAYTNGPDPETMTGDERVAEMRRIIGAVLTVRFGVIFKRITALVGRPVFDAEIAMMPDALIEEARNRPGGDPPVDALVHAFESRGNPVIVTVKESQP